MDKQILVTRSSMPDIDEYIEEIRGLWESHWLTNMGTKHKKFKNMLLEYLNTPYATLFVNGHLALECALAAFKLKGEVITTPFTFVSTAHSIVRCGLEPVFCDIKPDNYTIDPDNIESLITDKTSAIMPVHVYGNLCDFETIEKIAKKHNLRVIYDAAHAFGVKINGESVANFGDSSMFSFHATKVFNTIEGGALTFKDPSLQQVFNDIKNFGFTGPESVEYIGGNAKMNEFQAAMGICNLRHLDSEIAKRKTVFEKYVERLSNVNGIKISIPDQSITGNYAYFPVLFDHYKYTRDEIFVKLRDKNIFPRKYFYPLVSDFECYRDRFDSNQTPIAKSIAEHILTLPIYADLEMEIVDNICDTIIN